VQALSSKSKSSASEVQTKNKGVSQSSVAIQKTERKRNVRAGRKTRKVGRTSDKVTDEASKTRVQRHCRRVVSYDESGNQSSASSMESDDESFQHKEAAASPYRAKTKQTRQISLPAESENDR